MKKVFLLIAFATMSMGIKAQNKTSFFTEVQPVFAVQSGVDVGICLNLGVTFPLSNSASLGVGTGANSTFKFNSLVLPIFARFVLDNKEYDNSPFFMFDAGYSQDVDDFTKSGMGLWANPTVGFRMGKIYMGVGYYGSWTDAGGEWVSNINVKLGVSF